MVSGWSTRLPGPHAFGAFGAWKSHHLLRVLWLRKFDNFCLGLSEATGAE